MTYKQSYLKCRTLGVFSLMLLVAGAMVPITSVSADDCEHVVLDAEQSLVLVDSAARCATSSWDPTSTQTCIPNSYGGDTGDTTGSNCAIGTSSTEYSSSGRCGAGWAQQWQVSVELHEGDAEVSGWVSCNSKEKAKCLIHVGGAKFCTDDGESERGPIGCDVQVGEIAVRPVEGVVKCTDPVNPQIVIAKSFNITTSLDGPFRF